MIYCLINETLSVFKVGFSEDIPTRIKSLRTACPFPLTLGGVIKGPIQLEGHIHRELSQWKIRQGGGREWFKLDDGSARILHEYGLLSSESYVTPQDPFSECCPITGLSLDSIAMEIGWGPGNGDLLLEIALCNDGARYIAKIEGWLKGQVGIDDCGETTDRVTIVVAHLIYRYATNGKWSLAVRDGLMVCVANVDAELPNFALLLDELLSVYEVRVLVYQVQPDGSHKRIETPPAKVYCEGCRDFWHDYDLGPNESREQLCEGCSRLATRYDEIVPVRFNMEWS